MNSNNTKKYDKEYHEDVNIVESYDKRITKKYRLEHKYYTIDVWVNKLNRKGKRLVLDYACGTGNSTLKLLGKGLKAVSIDASLLMLKQLQKKAEMKKVDCFCVVGDVENLPFKNEVFDGMICAGALHHIPDINKGVEDQVRVLKKEGFIFTTEPFMIRPWISYPYFFFIKILKSFISVFINRRANITERLISNTDIDSIITIYKKSKIDYKLKYLVYWPIIFGILPEFIGYPLMLFFNKINKSIKKGDVVNIIAQKYR